MVSIAILGNGVVGSGLVELIEKNKKREWRREYKYN